MTLNAAVVGAGVVSDVHLSGLQDCPLTTLVAICDLEESRAREAAADYDIDWHTDFGEMLDAEDLDWIHLCTPVQTHLDLALTAIEAGVPIQIEKPITETREEFERLASASAEHDIPVTAVHQHNFDVVMRDLMTAVDAGRIGEVRAVDLLFIGETPPDYVNRGAWAFDLPGGEFEEGLPHPLYLLLRSGGLPRSIDDVHVQTTRYREYEQEFAYDGLQLHYPSEDDVLASATILAGSIPQRILTVHGEDGALLADFVSQTLVRLDKNYQATPVARARNNADRIRDRIAGSIDNVRAMVERRFDDSWEVRTVLGSHDYQLDREARALLGEGELPVPLVEAKWTIELMESIRESVEPEAAVPDPTVATEQVSGGN